MARITAHSYYQKHTLRGRVSHSSVEYSKIKQENNKTIEPIINTVWWKRVTQTVHRHPGKVSHVHRRALQPTQNLQTHAQALAVAHREARTQHITCKSKVTKESRQSHSDRTLTHAWTERTNIPTAVRDTACMNTHTHTSKCWLSSCLSSSDYLSLSLCFPSLSFFLSVLLPLIYWLICWS